MFENEGDEKPVLNTSYTGFSIYGRSLCLVVDPPNPTTDEVIPKRKRARTEKGKGGIEEWFVNAHGEEPSVDDI